MKVKCQKCNIFSEISNSIINENEIMICHNCGSEYDLEEARKTLKDNTFSLPNNTRIEENGRELIIKKTDTNVYKIVLYLILIALFGWSLNFHIINNIEHNKKMEELNPDNIPSLINSAPDNSERMRELNKSTPKINSVINIQHRKKTMDSLGIILTVYLLLHLYMLFYEITNKKCISISDNTLYFKSNPMPPGIKSQKINIENIKNIELIHPDENIKYSKEKTFDISLTLKNQKKINIIQHCNNIYEAMAIERRIKQYLSIDGNTKNDPPLNISVRQSGDNYIIETEKRPLLKVFLKNMAIISIYSILFAPFIAIMINNILNISQNDFSPILLFLGIILTVTAFTIMSLIVSLATTEIWYLSLIAEINEDSLSLRYSPLDTVWKKKININNIKNIFIRQEKRFPVKKETDKNISILNYNPLNPLNKIEDLDTFFIIELKDGKTLKIYTPIKDSNLLVYISNSIKQFLGIPAAATENA